MSMPSETIRRLRALQPGQSIIYWRGLHTDNADTPLYNELMHSIFACASELERQGLVKLSKQERGKDYTLIEYIATGI